MVSGEIYPQPSIFDEFPPMEQPKALPRRPRIDPELLERIRTVLDIPAPNAELPTIDAEDNIL